MAGSRRLRCIEIGEVDVLKVGGIYPGKRFGVSLFVRHMFTFKVAQLQQVLM
jgi:hypothetical protein